MKRLWTMALAVLAALAGLAVPGTAGAADGTGVRAPAPIDWQPCPSAEFGDAVAAAMQCALVDVPVDYRHPQGRTLSLRLSRRPATVQPSLGPLFVNPGGPGASAVAFASAFAVKESVYGQQGLSLDRFDIIGMDPRGVGGSTKLACSDPWDQSQFVVSKPGAPLTASERAAMAFAKSCAADPNVRFFGTNNVARDMDEVRRMLGADEISYLGVSYGTELGAAYLNLFPTHVRAAVLDSAANPTDEYVSFAAERIRAQQQAFDRYLDHCVKVGCAWAGGKDPRQAWDALQVRFDRDPGALADGTRITGDDLEGLALQAHSADATELDEKLDALVAGRDLDEVFSGRDQDPVPFLASNCLDYPIADYHAALSTLTKEVGPRAANNDASLLAVCSAWPRTDDKVAVRKLEHRSPVLVIAAHGDAQTPYASGVRLARGLEVPLLTWAANVHGAFAASPCASEKVVALLEHLDAVRRSGASCPNDARPDAPEPPDEPFS